MRRARFATTRAVTRMLSLLGTIALVTGCQAPPPPCPATPIAATASSSPSSAASVAAAPAAPSSPREREGFPIADGVPATLDAAALTRVRERAAATKSAALIIVQDGRILVDDYFGGDPERARLAMSVSKSVTALGLGWLVGKSGLELDAPLSAKVFPELAKTDKAGLTLRHLMNHTSGLPRARTGAKPEDWLVKTIESHVLAAKLEAEPGTRFAYNNNAVDFLSVVARRAAPEHTYFDDWLHLTLFGQLGVRGAFWSKDAKGDPRASGELGIRPIDLAKVGQVVLDDGKWRGRPIVPEGWVRQLVAPGQDLTDQCGLLWWRDGRPREAVLSESRFETWKTAGVEATTLAALKPFVGKWFASRAAAIEAFEKVVGAAKVEAMRGLLRDKKLRLLEQKTEVLSYRADGWLGQYVVVVPSARLVAVRMRDPRETTWKEGELDYADFRWDVLDVARVGVPVDERL